MSKYKSRPQRWMDACLKAESCLTELQEALQEIEEIKSEYEDWRDNLPEGLDATAVAEKLEAVCDLELDTSLSEVDEQIQELLAADLPLGFGRD